jgi:hypothetical protein
MFHLSLYINDNFRCMGMCAMFFLLLKIEKYIYFYLFWKVIQGVIIIMHGIFY